MKSAKTLFIELEQPKHLLPFGYYVGSVAPVTQDDVDGDYYYLHNDGNIYPTCNDSTITTTTGWFRTVDEAYDVAVKYYAKHGIAYPYKLDADVIKSQVMDF